MVSIFSRGDRPPPPPLRRGRPGRAVRARPSLTRRRGRSAEIDCCRRRCLGRDIRSGLAVVLAAAATTAFWTVINAQQSSIYPPSLLRQSDDPDGLFSAHEEYYVHASSLDDAGDDVADHHLDARSRPSPPRGRGSVPHHPKRNGTSSSQQLSWDHYPPDLLELESPENQLQWIRSAPCPGPNFSGPSRKCHRDIHARTIAPECVVYKCDPLHLRRKWVVLVGDSNLRYLFFSILDKTKIATQLEGYTDEERYCDREAMNEELKFRLSYRFVDTRETSSDCFGCDGKQTKVDRVMGNIHLPLSENGTVLPIPNGHYDRPDLVIMTTGLWEMLGIGDDDGPEGWHDAKPRLRSQFRSLLSRWTTQRTSKRLVWMTSPSARPKDPLRKRRMTKGRLRWLAAMETRMIMEEFPQVGLIENWAWTETEGFEGGDYHYYNCSMATVRKLSMGTMCRQLGLPPSNQDGTAEVMG